MRVTAETKRQTGRRIREAARNLFVDKGFDDTTTRDIATTAGIATGTLFNYFPSKESLAMALISEALTGVDEEFERKRRGEEDVGELLFLFIMACIRRLEPYRSFVGSAFETSLSPFVGENASGEDWAFRRDHLEHVHDLLHAAGLLNDPSLVSMHLYWTLYLGVLAFWSKDRSPNQEDTLVLLDQSVRLFVASLGTGATQPEVHHGA